MPTLPERTETSDPVARVTGRLFRHESARLVSMLTGIFGIRHLQLAEDVVQEATIRAFNTWPYQGIPDNPSAWLMRTAKNLALDALRRERLFREKEPEIARALSERFDSDLSPPDHLSDQPLSDALLCLIFASCHPILSEEQQVALALKVVCGFGDHEIARAFLVSAHAVAKRLTRARATLRKADVAFAIPEGPELAPRLGAVRRTLYLLFSEGHSATDGEQVVRRDLCDEAIRLAGMLADHPATGSPETHALLSLFCLNAARLPARLSETGQIIRLEDQDRSRWDQASIQRGMRHLAFATQGDRLSEYHLQAAISACHCTAADDASTDWTRILSLYDDLLQITPSPVILLNRAVAMAKVRGPHRAIRDMQETLEGGSLDTCPLTYAVLGDLEAQRENPAAAAAYFERALTLTTSAPERSLFASRLREFTTGPKPKNDSMMKANAIEDLLDTYRKAHADRDAIALGALYEEDAVICDLAPPLVRNGFDQPAIKAWFETWDGPVRLEFRDERTHRSHDLATVTTLVRVTGSKKGEEHDLWTRATFVFRNTENRWLIAHEHTSVPFHMDGSLRAATDLEPPGGSPPI